GLGAAQPADGRKGSARLSGEGLLSWSRKRHGEIRLHCGRAWQAQCIGDKPATGAERAPWSGIAPGFEAVRRAGYGGGGRWIQAADAGEDSGGSREPYKDGACRCNQLARYGHGSLRALRQLLDGLPQDSWPVASYATGSSPDPDRACKGAFVPE